MFKKIVNIIFSTLNKKNLNVIFRNIYDIKEIYHKIDHNIFIVWHKKGRYCFIKCLKLVHVDAQRRNRRSNEGRKYS